MVGCGPLTAMGSRVGIRSWSQGRAARAGLQGRRVFFPGFWEPLGAWRVEEGSDSHFRGGLGRGGEVGADRSPRYAFSVFVTADWGRLDLNSSTGGTAARPGLSGTWPLGSGGLDFAGGCFQVTLQMVHRWFLGWEPYQT